ncbi:MAG TPA: DUF1289 domain-containing protein [Gammaproteobacteria bacterium]|jgi:predicted Fe-S protein YdhL (DUF1289 family)|nr:DUF1289 domain-containing protein [Gammaproteobacteria bacterium]
MTTAPKTKEKPVKSPCVSLCALDINDICMGCQRTANEISAWGKMTNEQRRAVLQKVNTRAREQGLLS